MFQQFKEDLKQEKVFIQKKIINGIFNDAKKYQNYHRVEYIDFPTDWKRTDIVCGKVTFNSGKHLFFGRSRFLGYYHKLAPKVRNYEELVALLPADEINNIALMVLIGRGETSFIRESSIINIVSFKWIKSLDENESNEDLTESIDNFN
jgi:hypothetical protein